MIPDLALICSHGRTSTYWLTRVLNSHPEILAAHGPHSPPLIVSESPDRYAAQRGGMGREACFDDFSIVQIIEEMRSEGPQKFRCRVHAASLAQAHEKLRREGCPGQVTLVNITRHPVTRSQSFAMHWYDRHRYDFGIGTTLHLLEIWGTDEIFQRFRRLAEEKFGSSADMTKIENVFFIIAILLPARERFDFALDYPQYRYENIIRDKEMFAALLADTFGDELPISQAFLNHALATGPLNQSRVDGPPLGAAEQVFGAWPHWQQEIYRIVADEYKIDEIYKPFGYDFSFLNKVPA